MNMFATIPENVQATLATSAGVVLKSFAPDESPVAETIRQNILFATSGGVNLVCAPTHKDFGEDIDNCPKNAKELLEIEGYECKMSGTALTVDPDVLKSLVGAADVAKTTASSIKPRLTVAAEDFTDLWYVCPYGKDGGFIAVNLKNAMSTGGFSMQSTDKEKGTFDFEYTGFSSVANPEEVPFAIYTRDSVAAAAAKVKV